MNPTERTRAWRAKQLDEYTKSRPDLFESLPGEVFRDIPGYEGQYQVSNQGRVKSLKTQNGRIMKLKKIWSGYVQVCLCQGNVKTHHSVHALVLEAFVSLRPDKYVANHIDGDRSNNRLSNLEWVTQQKNIMHKYEVMCQPHAVPPHSCGENHPQALSRENARQIRAAYESGLSARQIGRQFGTSKTTVLKIVNGEHWSNN